MSNKQSKQRKPLGSEPGLGALSDREGQEPVTLTCSFFRHPNDDEIDLSGRANLVATTRMPPDGKTRSTWKTTVRDKHQNPVAGVSVQFTVNYIQPGGNWRSANGMKTLYNQNNGNGKKAENLVNQGVIRVVGSLSANSAVTDANGIAQVTYQTSHIASDFDQRVQARERLVASIGNLTDSLDIDIGWTDLKTIQSVPGGLRVVGATGRRVHPDLHRFLKGMGDAVKAANWPHPVTVTAASLRWGGQYPPHFTHKHGWTLDLRPMSKDGNSTWAKRNGTSAPNYDFDRTKILIDNLNVSNGTVYFNGKNAGGTPKAGHDNHIHVSWLSSPNIYVGGVTI